MVADYFTKPLQGQLFRDMRDVIMGYKDIHWFMNRHSCIKEHVSQSDSGLEKVETENDLRQKKC